MPGACGFPDGKLDLRRDRRRGAGHRDVEGRAGRTTVATGVTVSNSRHRERREPPRSIRPVVDRAADDGSAAADVAERPRSSVDAMPPEAMTSRSVRSTTRSKELEVRAAEQAVPSIAVDDERRDPGGVNASIACSTVVPAAPGTQPIADGEPARTSSATAIRSRAVASDSPRTRSGSPSAAVPSTTRVGAGREDSVDGRLSSEPTADLDARPGPGDTRPATAADGGWALRVGSPSGPRRGRRHGPTGARPRKRRADGDRVVREGLLAGEVALAEPHDAAAPRGRSPEGSRSCTSTVLAHVA